MLGSNQNALRVISNEDGMSSDPDITVTGEDAEEVETENFGFLALNGDVKVKLFPDTFPESSIPISSASLFTIASKKGVFAAAGPSTFILGTTESLRKAFTAAPAGDTRVNYNPTLSLPLPTPISHIVFNSSEEYLILGASSGGLAVYSTQSLGSPNNQAKPLFEVSTHGLALREIKPNPSDATAELIAVVTQNGDLRIMKLAQQEFVPGKSGEVLKTSISTVAWSQRGKQIICGLTDGSCAQLTPDGDERATIPKPPGLTDHYVSHVTWLENNLFLIGLTPIPSNPREPNNDSIFYIFSRTSNTEGFRFQKLPDPTPPFGMTSRQAYFFCGEIKHWHPHLQDALVLANTSSSDIGLITRFTAAINNVPEGTFTVTTIANDSRRAALPLGDQYMTDTSPIGVALDLSSRENVSRPITGEEPEETGPLPIFMVLNNESLVSAWHIVYNDAVRNNCEYSQLVVVKEKQASYVTQQPEAKVSAFNTGSGFKIGGDSKPFAAPGIAPAFGQPNLPAKPAFGQPAFGQPAFGQPAFGRPAFEQAALGQPGWGAAPSTSTASSAPEFGPSSFGSTAPPSIGGTTPASSSAFGKFASAGSFASMAASTTAGSGPAWAKGLGSNTTSSPTFGGLESTNDSTSSFGGLQRSGSGGAFGSATVPLKIHSTFQADKTGGMSSTPENQGGLFGGFGSTLVGALGVDSTLSVPDADMDAESPMVATPVDKEEDMQSTPSEPSTPPQARPAAPGPGLFGDFRASKPAPGFASAAATTTAPKSPPPAPLPPSPGSISKTTKEEIPDVPLPQMPGDKCKDDQSKIEDKEVPKNVFSSNATLGASSPFQKPSSGPFSSPAGEKNPFANTATFGRPSITSSPLSWTSEGPSLGTSAPSSTFVKQTPFAPAFSSSIKAPTPGLFSQPKPDSQARSPAPEDKPALSSSSSTAPPKSPLGVSDGKPAPESLSAPPQSAIVTTTQPLPPLGEGSQFSTSPAVRKDTKAGGSVFDSPPTELTGGIFAGLSKKKPVKSDRLEKAEIKPSLSSRISTTPATKSTLGKKPEAGKKLDLGRAKTTLVNPMHRFGTGKSRPTMKPSPLSRRALEDEDEDEDEEDLEEEDEVEEEGEGDNDEDYEEIESEVDEPEVEEDAEEKPVSKFAVGDLKPKKPKSALGDAKHTSAIGNMKQETASVLGHKVPAQLLPKPTSTPGQELAPRVTTPAPPAPQPEYEDEKIRNILHSEIPVEPNPAAPIFAQNDKIVEASPDDSFEAIYDKAYESCNVMVNSIGVLARNMEAYVSAHSKAPDELKHVSYRPVHQLTEVDEWRLSELAHVGAMINNARHVLEMVVKGGEVLNESINDLTKGILRLQTKASELARLERVVTDPKGAAAAQAHYLPPEQALQQRELRNKLATVQYQLEEAEKSVTMLKAHVVARDRGTSGGRVKPPTVEAVRNTILKLMTMVERKNSDVEYLGELLRRLKAKQAFGGGSMYEESSFMRTTMMAIGTPAREKARAVENVGVLGAEGSRTAVRMGLHSDELELEEVREEITARRQMGDKLRKAMKLVGTRVTNVA